MDTKAIRYFERVYEERSINKAAKQLFITPQGLSKVIQGLEEELGATLFERSKQGMKPTECGRYLYSCCPAILNQYDDILNTIQRIRTQEKKFVIGFACGVLNVFPFAKMAQVREICGDSRVQWDEYSNAEVVQYVRDGRCDIGFVIGQIADIGLWSREMYSRNVDAIIYEGHPLYEKDALSVGDLKGETFVTLNERFYCYHSFVQRCHDFGFSPDIRVKTMESQLIYRFCRQRVGIGIDVNIHQQDIRLEQLRRVPLYDAIPWKISFIVRNDRIQETVIQRLVGLFTPR